MSDGEVRDNEYVLVETICKKCGATLNGCRNVTTGHQPKAGDISVCASCANPMVVTDRLTLRDLTSAERRKLESDPHYREVAAMIACEAERRKAAMH